MAVILGTGAYRYEVIDNWAKLPPGREFNADVAAVGVDAQDRVYAFNRGQHPMVVFDRDGNFLRSWGEGLFHRAHGVHVAPDDTIWLTDDGDHTVRHCTLDGKVLLTIGVPGKPAPYMSGEPFHRCTHTALSPAGDLYVSDGYGNSRVHKYAPNGTRLFSWGEPGTDPGQFNIAHNICCDQDGWVYVADRENHRVQVFDGQGRFETQWSNMHRPSGLYLHHGGDPRFYVGEIGAGMAVKHGDAEHRAAHQHLQSERRDAGAPRQSPCRPRARPVHLAARTRRGFARRHLRRRGVVHQLGSSRADPAGTAEPAKARQGARMSLTDSELREHLTRAAAKAGLSLPELTLPERHDVVLRRMRFHYLDWGTRGRPPILFLHGGGLNAHTWDLVCLGLRRERHCLALDQRGHGDSEWSPEMDYSTESHVGDLEAFVDRLGLDRFVLVGMSLGGANGLAWAGHHSRRLAGLVLVDVGPETRHGRRAEDRRFHVAAEAG
jgi:hypothetical protein